MMMAAAMAQKEIMARHQAQQGIQAGAEGSTAPVVPTSVAALSPSSSGAGALVPGALPTFEQPQVHRPPLSTRASLALISPMRSGGASLWCPCPHLLFPRAVARRSPRRWL